MHPVSLHLLRPIFLPIVLLNVLPIVLLNVLLIVLLIVSAVVADFAVANLWVLVIVGSALFFVLFICCLCACLFHAGCLGEH